MSMGPELATASAEGASGTMSGAAVAEASAPVGPSVAGAQIGEVVDDGQSFAKGRCGYCVGSNGRGSGRSSALTCRTSPTTR
jgi:hypothetical protein